MGNSFSRPYFVKYFRNLSEILNGTFFLVMSAINAFIIRLNPNNQFNFSQNTESIVILRKKNKISL
jgi:hypothetical protein